MSDSMLKIIKKDGSLERFNPDKIKRAINASATRVCVKLT